MGNSFGQLFRITTWGESHGGGVGVVIDGCPPRIALSAADVQSELDRRRPGQSSIVTQRDEADRCEILSGVSEGRTLGTPISIIVRNEDARPDAYAGCTQSISSLGRESGYHAHLVASLCYRSFAFLGPVLFLILSAQNSGAQNTLIALPERRDMAFDHSGNYLYTSTSDGWVRRYNLATGVLDAGYNLGGSLNGIDVAADDSFLLVAQNSTSGTQGTFHRVELSNGNVTNINYTLASGESGAWDVAVAANGLALVTTQAVTFSTLPLRQIDLTTNAITIRNDFPGPFSNRLETKTPIVRSANGARLAFFDTTSSGGFPCTYSAASNSFGPKARADRGLSFASAAVSRDGSLLAMRIGNDASFNTAPALNYVRSFHNIDSGIGFDATADRFYALASATDEIIAYDSITFAELYRMTIGEDIGSGTAQFGSGNLLASNDGRYLAIETPSGIRLLTLPTMLPPPVTPTFGTPKDMVFDRTSQRLYITTAEGFVWPYHLSTAAFETPYNLGGSLAGVDIAAGDSYLLVAQHDFGLVQGAFQKVDLATRAVTSINYNRGFGEGGAWDVAIGSNELALATTDILGSGSTPLRQIASGTNALTIRADAPPGPGGNGGVYQPAQIHRSADGTRMYFLEGNISSGPVFTYSASTNAFGPLINTNSFLTSASAAVNRNGTLVATRIDPGSVSLSTAPNFVGQGGFGALNSGVAFDAINDMVYGVSSFNSQVIAYDTNTLAERFRFDVGEAMSAGALQFGPGLLVASPDGRYLALQTPTTVRIYSVPAVPLVSVTSVKTHANTDMAIDLPLNGPRGVECRSGGVNGQHTIVFTFGQNLASVGGVTLTGTGSVSDGRIDASDSRRYIVKLSGVANAQYIKISLQDVLDMAGNRTGLISQQMGVLEGDTTGNGSVTASDVGLVKGQSGQPVTAANFRSDVNVSGSINASDIGLAKSRSGTQLP